MKENFEQLVEQLVRGGFFLEEGVEILEKSLITRALDRTGGNRTEASKLLGIHRNTLQRKMRDYKLEEEEVRRKPLQKAKPAARRTAAR
jgi:DNA-binding NtrC family response regulator